MVVKSVELDVINKESVDLDNVSLEEVFDHLKCTKDGLSSDEVKERLESFGYNKLEEKKESKVLKFLGFMWNPVSWVMEAAAIIAIVFTHGGKKEADYHDFGGIIVLLIINSTITFIKENNAGNAAAALMARLAPKAKVLRDGKWSVEDAAILIPGDIISIILGDFVPADARLLLEGDPLNIDQGAITKKMTAIEEMAGMDVLCSDKTGTLTLNKLTVDKNMIEVFAKCVDKDQVILMAARASRFENQDAIDTAIVLILSDPKEARAGIKEIHFLPFNPTDKRTALTYIDGAGKMHSQ